MELISNSTDGSFYLNDLENYGLSLTLELPMMTLNLSLTDISGNGVNSFSQFEVFSNNYNDYTLPEERFNFTLHNNISLDHIEATVHIEVGWLDKESWITEGAGFLGFSFDYTIGIENLHAEIATAHAVNPDEIMNFKFGQLLGATQGMQATVKDKALAGLDCASGMIYGFHTSFLEVEIGNLSTPVLSNFPDRGVKDLVEDATDLGLQIMRSALTKSLPDVTQHWVRSRLNNWLTCRFINRNDPVCDAGWEPLVCENYADQGDQYPDFLNSAIINTVENAINNVLGGEVVKEGSGSVNSLVQIFGEVCYCSFSCFSLSYINLLSNNPS